MSESENAQKEALLDQSALDEIVENTPKDEDAAPGAEGAGEVFPDLEAATGGEAAGSIDMLMDVDLEVKIELGRTDMTIESVLGLKKGSVVELDKLAGDPVDVLVNERPVARGEILVVNDNFCVRITEITDPEAGFKVNDEDE